MRRSETVDHAERLVREEGLSQSEAARRAGCSYTAIWRRLNPEKARERARRDNARPERKAAKRAHERNGTCPKCGGVRWRYSGEICRSCEVAGLHRAKAARQDDIVALWAGGASMPDIARELGTTVESIGVEMVRIRRERGVDALPYRYRLKDPTFS